MANQEYRFETKQVHVGQEQPATATPSPTPPPLDLSVEED